jgi:hypothetical protein
MVLLFGIMIPTAPIRDNDDSLNRVILQRRLLGFLQPSIRDTTSPAYPSRQSRRPPFVPILVRYFGNHYHHLNILLMSQRALDLALH